MHHDDDDDDDVFRKKHSHLVFLYNSLKYQLIAVKTSHNSVEGMMNMSEKNLFVKHFFIRDVMRTLVKLPLQQ